MAARFPNVTMETHSKTWSMCGRTIACARDPVCGQVSSIRYNGKGVFYAKNSPHLPLCLQVEEILFTPHQVSSETSQAFSAELASRAKILAHPTNTSTNPCGPGILGREDGGVYQHCTCLPVEAIRMGAGVPIYMGRLTDGTLGGSGDFDGPVLRCVHPGLAHLGHLYRGSCEGLERREMENEWDDNQTRLEELTKLGYLEYTLGPQCGVCAGRE